MLSAVLLLALFLHPRSFVSQVSPQHATQRAQQVEVIQQLCWLLPCRHLCPRHLGYLHPGEYFGEYSCLLGQERSASVVASSYVELYSLSRADLELVLQQWPELAEQFEAMGECWLTINVVWVGVTCKCVLSHACSH